MFHNVVVPLDGSSLAEVAIGPAGWIAAGCWARVHLVRVHVPRVGNAGDDNEATRAATARYLHEVATWLREEASYDVCTAVLDGSPALAIADYADRVEADIVVMTTHGRTGAQRRRMGSVASVVAHHVSCPVLLARGEAGEFRPPPVALGRILIPVDGTERVEAIHEFALQLASLGHPSFHIVYTMSPALIPQLIHAGAAGDAAEEQNERQAMMKAESYVSGIARRLRSAGLRAEVLVTVTDDPVRAVLEAAERDGSDALVKL